MMICLFYFKMKYVTEKKAICRKGPKPPIAKASKDTVGKPLTNARHNKVECKPIPATNACINDKIEDHLEEPLRAFHVNQHCDFKVVERILSPIPHITIWKHVQAVDFT
jgi:hypothetical protein